MINNPVIFYSASVLITIFALLALFARNVVYSLLAAVVVFFFRSTIFLCSRFGIQCNNPGCNIRACCTCDYRGFNNVYDKKRRRKKEFYNSLYNAALFGNFPACIYLSCYDVTCYESKYFS